MRGFGAINVEPLAQAMIHGGIAPAFLPTQRFQAAYMPQGQLTEIPAWEYATDGFADQLATLLGGSVVQAPPPGDFQGTGIPLSNWVSVNGQQILPGNLFQPGTVLSFADLCTAENYLTNSIPGSDFGPSCTVYATSNPNPLVGSGGIQAPVIAAPPPQNVVTSTPGSSGGSVPIPDAGGAVPLPPAPSQIASGTPGASLNAPATAPLSANIGGFDLSQIPWWGWVAGAGILVLALKGGR